eukprot:7391917-Prymnesium_polylepis.3
MRFSGSQRPHFSCTCAPSNVPRCRRRRKRACQRWHLEIRDSTGWCFELVFRRRLMRWRRVKACNHRWLARNEAAASWPWHSLTDRRMTARRTRAVTR